MRIPVESVAQCYRCQFWDGRTTISQLKTAASIDDLENYAYCIAHREGWQYLGCELVEVAA